MLLKLSAARVFLLFGPQTISGPAQLERGEHDGTYHKFDPAS